MSNELPDESPEEFPRHIGRIGCPPGKKKMSRDNMFWCKCFKDIEAAQEKTGKIPWMEIVRTHFTDVDLKQKNKRMNVKKQLRRMWDKRAAIVGDTALGLRVRKMTRGRAPVTVTANVGGLIYKEVLRIALDNGGIHDIHVAAIMCSLMSDGGGYDVRRVLSKEYLDTCDTNVANFLKTIFTMETGRKEGRKLWECTWTKINSFRKRWRLMRRTHSRRTYYDVSESLDALRPTLIHAWATCAANDLDPSTSFENTDQSHHYAWETRAMKLSVPASSIKRGGTNTRQGERQGYTARHRIGSIGMVGKTILRFKSTTGKHKQTVLRQKYPGSHSNIGR